MSQYSYGEKGYAVISKVLHDWVPYSSQDMIHEIPRQKFIDRILIPETVILLIAEDLNIDEKAALAILQESRAYQTHWFPIDNESTKDDSAYRMRRKIVAEGKKRIPNPSPVLSSMSPSRKTGRNG